LVERLVEARFNLHPSRPGASPSVSV
jgi:hypothetical protein